MYRLLIFTLLSITFIACEEEATQSCISTDYDTVFTVEKTQEYCFPDDVKISIDSLANQFCPCDAICIWGGEMLIYMTIESREEVIDYIFHSERQVGNELENLNIEFIDLQLEQACDEEHPNPTIISADLKVSKI